MSEQARDFLATRALPVPVITMQPPFAITGKPAYLALGGPTVIGGDDPGYQFYNPVDDETVYLEATSDYVVDWGDRFNPDSRVVTTSQGGRWPGGDLTHTYTVADPAVTITVTQRWRATWFAGDESGELDGITTTATLNDYRVTWLEAVRNR